MNIVACDRVTPQEEENGLLETVFEDGKLVCFTDLYEIRQIRAAWAKAAVAADVDLNVK